MLRSNNIQNRARHLVGLILALLVMTSGIALPGSSWSRQMHSNLNPTSSANSTNTPVPSAKLQQAEQATDMRMREAYGKLPLSFEANHGQTDLQVKFLSRGSNHSLFLTSNEAVIELPRADFGSRNKMLVISSTKSTERKSPTRNLKPSNPQSAVLRMKLVGADSAPQVEGLDLLPGQSNYLIGNDPKQWRTNVHNYARVQYRDVYPGVSLVYYGNQQKLEYDFVVAPGANPYSIKIGFDGAEDMRIDAIGDLMLNTAAGEIRQHKPIVYQDVAGVRQRIAGRYVLKGKHEVGFELGAYDANKQLVIDPVLVYSTTG